MIETQRILAAVSESVDSPSTFGSIWDALGKPDKRMLYASLMTLADTGHVWAVEGFYVRRGRSVGNPVADSLFG